MLTVFFFFFTFNYANLIKVSLMDIVSSIGLLNPDPAVSPMPSFFFFFFACVLVSST